MSADFSKNSAEKRKISATGNGKIVPKISFPFDNTGRTCSVF